MSVLASPGSQSDDYGAKTQKPLTIDRKTITLTFTEPPRVNILKPTGSDLADNNWVSGEDKTITWKITDKDTSYIDYKEKV